jgi:mercuric reductase
MLVNEAVEALNALLPLAQRQARLPEDLRLVHRRILSTFRDTGRAPSDVEPDAARTLADRDLIVLDDTGRITGAYPFTLEDTAHSVQIGRTTASHAMCSLDALAMAPMFDAETRTTSTCAHTGVQIVVVQKGYDLIDSSPDTPWIGIRWQEPCGHAASSLCRDMVFLADETAAIAWRGDDPDSVGIFALPEAIDFAARFFVPLVG